MIAEFRLVGVKIRMKVALWMTRILLGVMVLYWLAAIPQLLLAYGSSGIDGVDNKISHWVYAGQDPTMWDGLERWQLIARAYRIFIALIVLTWGLRELQALTKARIKKTAAAT
jgi:hypothetical protein